jgi:hypothetical protein
MARFCTVAPVNILQRLKEDGLFDNHHLVLAHDIVKKPKEYEALFADLNPLVKFVILDNSVIELGTAVDTKMIADAAAIVLPTCVVLPDVLLDHTATVNDCKLALESEAWQKLADSYGLMMIPQGKHLQDFAWCAQEFAHEELVQYWGVPRNLVEHQVTRHYAIKMVKTLNKTNPIHMMGFSDDLTDDVICANMPEVYSIDSAVPLRLKEHIRFNVRYAKRGDWWETAEYDRGMIEHNLTLARSWLRYK